MEPLAFEMLSSPQRQRLDRFGISRCLDVHCHCLPGLDDGPSTLKEAVLLCRKIVADGVTTTVATPHQLGQYSRVNSATKVREAVVALSAELAREGVPLEIFPGADVRVDERMLSLLDKDEILTLADRKKYLLLELPHELYVDPQPLLVELGRRGIRPVITHPERYRYLRQSFEIIESWVAQGAVLQITAGSFLGDFGRTAYEMSWKLARCGWVGLVATDAHNEKFRPPRLSSALEMLSLMLSAEYARQVCLDNPLAVFEGYDISMEAPGVK